MPLFSAGFEGNQGEIAAYRGAIAISESMRADTFFWSYMSAKITSGSQDPSEGIFGVQLPRSRGPRRHGPMEPRRRVVAGTPKDCGPVGQQHVLRASIFRSCPSGRASNRVPS